MRLHLNATTLPTVAIPLSMYAIRAFLFASLASLLLVICNHREVYAERVGFSFSGNFTARPSYGGPAAAEHNVFGTVFALDAPFSGSFSFDTTASGVISYDGARDYKQQIQGGFTFNVQDAANGASVLKLVSNAYSIRVSNDYAPTGAPVASDLLSVDFDTVADPSLPPIIKNGVPYTKKPIRITAPISWDWQKFNEPDDPKLRSSLDMSEFFPYPGNILAFGNAPFVITSFSRIAPVDGDYNVDGVVDASDYVEWRKAYGSVSEDHAYADGNHDGAIGSEDFVVWRHALAVSSSVGTSLVPEPSAATLVAVLLFGGRTSSRRRIPCT